jgi:hypothetical protein
LIVTDASSDASLRLRPSRTKSTKTTALSVSSAAGLGAHQLEHPVGEACGENVGRINPVPTGKVDRLVVLLGGSAPARA